MAKVNETKSTEPAPEPPEDHGDAEAVGITQWEFIETPPTQEDVVRLLKTLRPVYDVETIDYADYVQALPQKKKVKRPSPQNPNVMVTDSIEAWVLYMSVAGRMKMLEEAAYNNGWAVDFAPEPTTPTGIPGMLQHGDGRIVYREYAIVEQISRDGTESKRLGSKPGTAWVPYSGGSMAAGSNPYEKVETSARGRAIGAWGFGVFPGSGVATLEEMQGITGNKRAMDSENEGSQRGGNGGQRRRRRSREELLGSAKTSIEEFRQRRGVSEETMNQEICQYLASIGVSDPAGADGMVEWDRVNDGQLQLLGNKIGEHLTTLVSQEWQGQ